MINGKKVLAYIPARSGSKSIKDKNLADLGGIPLIAYSIKAAKQSRYVDRIIVSTDSQKYADIAEKYGAEAPFLRPAELATDTAREMDTALHLIRWIEENEKQKYDIICKLEATTPLKTAEDIDNAIKMLVDRDANSIITINEVSETPLWMNTLPKDLSMKNFLKPEIQKLNRQELPTYYFIDGLFIALWKQIKEKESWYDDNSYAYIMPKERAVDIDDEFDLEFARFILGRKNAKEI